jgi:hypothetical protein
LMRWEWRGEKFEGLQWEKNDVGLDKISLYVWRRKNIMWDGEAGVCLSSRHEELDSEKISRQNISRKQSLANFRLITKSLEKWWIKRDKIELQKVSKEWLWTTLRSPPFPPISGWHNFFLDERPHENKSRKDQIGF